jgi:hypothetical protein
VGQRHGAAQRSGARHGRQRADNQLTNVNNSAEIWNPSTGHWHVGPSAREGAFVPFIGAAVARCDGARGGRRPVQVNTNAEIYFRPTSSMPQARWRPAPDHLCARYRQRRRYVDDRVDTPAISRVTLIKSGSVTPVNMDQRFIGCRSRHPGICFMPTCRCARATRRPVSICCLQSTPPVCRRERRSSTSTSTPPERRGRLHANRGRCGGAVSSWRAQRSRTLVGARQLLDYVIKSVPLRQGQSVRAMDR